MNRVKTPLLRRDGVQTILASLLCILGGLLVGYLVLLIIKPEGAAGAITAILRNFFKYPVAKMRMKYLGQCLARTAPLLMCALSVLFAYKVGIFNIGAAGQYVAGACAALYCALGLKLPWYACMLAAIAAGAMLGVISGALKIFCNVNVVISGIMLNWIALYATNWILSPVKKPSAPDTLDLLGNNNSALLPKMGLDTIFNDKHVTMAIPLALIVAVVIWVVLNKTKFGYELKATGNNYHAAKYAGMKENRNILLTMIISGGLAGLGASMLYQTGIVGWETTAASVPAMGFNGIAVAFLGGLNPLGAILSAFFIQYLTAGGGFVDLTVYCAQISDLIAAIIIYLCAFVVFFKYKISSGLDRRDDRKQRKQGGAAK